MANLYQFSLDRALDGSGNPLSGAKLNVYRTGTTTPETFYTDGAGTSAGTSPVTSDAEGRFAPVFLDPAKVYRIKVTDSAGTTTVYDVDPVRGSDDGSLGGVLVVESRAMAINLVIPAEVDAVLCEGYATKGDRGQALYVRVGSNPGNVGKFQSSVDSSWWELRENVLNPFMFGAAGDDTTDDSAAIQAMFTHVNTKAVPFPINFMGAKYYLASGVTLPKVPSFNVIRIDGAGAVLRASTAIVLLSCPMPANQTAASVAIGQSAFHIQNLNFQGNGTAGQVGLHLIATYTSVVSGCHFLSTEYGSIGTFCLASAWRDNRYTNCTKRGAMVQSGVDYETGSPLWTGATLSNSASNVSVFENCRVYGISTQTSAFGIFASDAVRLTGCISEGGGANYDVHYDYQSSTTVKQFYVHMFHAEAPNALLNFKVRATGKVVIDSVIRQYPAPLYDALGSVNCEVHIKGLAFLGNMPTVTGTGPNPNGRWFFHSDGGGFGGTESGLSSGVGFRFSDCVESAYATLTDTAKWEAATLPQVLNVRGLLQADGGVHEYGRPRINFGSQLNFPDHGNATFAGLNNGTVTSATTSVPANSSVTESFSVTGLRRFNHTVFVNPYNSAYVPPAGIVWSAWLEVDDAFKIRFTNVTGSSISLATNAVWRYCAPRAS